MIDARIPMMGRSPDPNRAFSDGLTTAQNFQKTKEFMKNAPLRDQLMQMKMQQEEYTTEKSAYDAENRSKLQGAMDADYYVKNDKQEGAINALEARARRLESEGKDPSNTLKALETAMTDWDAFKYKNTQFLEMANQQSGGASSGNVQSTQNYKNGAQIITQRNGNRIVRSPSGQAVTGADAEKVINDAVNYESQFAYRKSNAGRQGTIDANVDSTPRIADSEAAIKGAVKSAEVDEDVKGFKKKADITKENASADEKRKLDKEWNVYQSGLDAFAQSIGATWNGSFQSILPALTGGQRISEAGTDILFNSVVGAFKVGGGPFTDDDAARIYSMLPTRADSPEVAQTKLMMLDQVMRAKAGRPPSDQAPTITNIKRVK